MAKRKDPAAVALGRRGGKNSREFLTPEKRTELGRWAAAARWALSAKVGSAELRKRNLSDD